MKKSERIREMLERGCKYPEIMREADCAASTIAYHAKIMGKQQYTFERKTYDWSAIQQYYDEGHTFADITRKFGADHGTLNHAKTVGKLLVDTSRERKAFVQRKRLERQLMGETSRRKVWGIEQLCENSVMSQASLRKMLKRASLIPAGCAIPECPLYGVADPKWAGSSIVLHLDHENGISNDNRISNLRWLCPNCHSQTETYCGRNHKKG